MPEEPLISINGRPLTEAESMTIRVALMSFLSEMVEPGSLGDDAHGKAMRDGYLAHGQAISEKMRTA